MYAVIKTGGKQARVQQGQRLDVERLGAELGSDVDLAPVLLVDGDTVLSTPAELAGVSVTARVVGESKGPKVIGFKYKHKSRSRRRWGHRQQYDTIEITGITQPHGRD
ncbi:MAG: 50S ribosomal protein L21 [Acidimicrobiia bacterium]